MRSSWLLLLALAGCDRVFDFDPTGPDAGPHLDGYLARKALTVTRTDAETLTDFPLSVLLDDPDLAARAGPSGLDVTFTAADGVTPLDKEIVAYAAGSLEAWVRLPSLPPGATTIFLYYGGPVSASVAAATWSDRHIAVWHMADTGNTERDRTANKIDLLGSAGTTAGVIGAARDYNGAGDALCTMSPSGGGPTIDVGSDSFAFELVMRAGENTGTYDIPLLDGGSTATEPGFDVEITQSSWGVNLVGEKETQDHLSLGEPVRGRWIDVGIVVDRPGQKIAYYLDGAIEASGEIEHVVGSVTSSDHLCLSVEGNDFHGAIDEARIYRGPLPGAWFAATHANLADRAHFLTVGPEERLR